MLTARISDYVAVIATLDPQTITSGPTYSGVVDMSLWTHVRATLMLGDMASETCDFAVYTCADSSGNTPVSLKACTQLAASATTHDNKQLIIDLLPDELNAVLEATRYIKFGVTVGGSGGPAAILVEGIPRHSGGITSNNATVVQVKE